MIVLDPKDRYFYVNTEGEVKMIPDVYRALDVTEEAQRDALTWGRYNGLTQALLFMRPPVHNRTEANIEAYRRRIETIKNRWSAYKGKEEDRRIFLVYSSEKGEDTRVYILVVYDDHTECFNHRLEEFKNQRGGGDAHANGVMDMLKPLCMWDPVAFLIKNSW